MLQSHLAHLKTKHGGFTPSQVSGQNCFKEYIPGLIEIGVEEKERRELASQSAARQLTISSRAGQVPRCTGRMFRLNFSLASMQLLFWAFFVCLFAD